MGKCGIDDHYPHLDVNRFYPSDGLGMKFHVSVLSGYVGEGEGGGEGV